MSQADYGVALMLFFIASSFFVYNYFGPLRKERQKAQRYRLYAVRDKLVALVAEKKLKEEDTVFQFLYTGLNSIIPKAKPLGLRKTVEALKDSSLREAKDDQNWAEFLRCINHKDPQVRKTAQELFGTLGEILIAQSLFVKIAARLAVAGFNLNRLYKGISQVFKVQSEAYAIYREIDDRRQKLAPAS